ncbi:hypothetical protein C8034_v012216 [Colletotrichum sidae]|uniref:Replicase polyprotein 1a n=1 Tax=Colletotrichum sidae TaxID=1347389 RepID=A0A4R8THY0_9PEZI|nr:hypothetical protein C8034_v012216 [Colletotrichum sidae]
MFGLLPDLTPRDSHSIWYTSSRNPVAQAALLEAHEQRNSHDNSNSHQHASSRRAGQLLIERSALARLRADELTLDRRRLNVQNFGSTWLKPPAVPKTLHQMREEKKEQEEHAEAMRREALVHELAEAEAAGNEVLEDAPAEGGLEEEEEEVNLDDDIPDAEEGSFGFDGELESEVGEPLSAASGSVDDDVSSEEEDDDDEDDDDAPESAEREELVAARMRVADDAYRQAMARGDDGAGELYGVEEDLDAEAQAHMLDEDDLLGPGDGAIGGEEDDLGMGMDMDADLDDEIPEARELSGVYEHTDSEVGMTSSIRLESSDEEDDDDEEDDGDISFAPRAAPLMAPRSPTGNRGVGRPMLPRSSLDLSGLLSAESSMIESSMVQMQSSPNVRAQRR